MLVYCLICIVRKNQTRNRLSFTNTPVFWLIILDKMFLVETLVLISSIFLYTYKKLLNLKILKMKLNCNNPFPGPLFLPKMDQLLERTVNIWLVWRKFLKSNFPFQSFFFSSHIWWNYVKWILTFFRFDSKNGLFIN
jgi:hypothetical protein